MFYKRFNKEPGAVVLRLFLRPNHPLQIDHPPEASNQRVSRKWIELLHTDDLRVLVARRVTRFDKVIGVLATATHQPPGRLITRRTGSGRHAPEQRFAASKFDL